MPRRSRLARLLLATGLLQSAAALAWVAWCVPASPLLAAAGAVLVALAAPLVLAVEFALMALVTRGDRSAPQPGARELFAAWLRECTQLLRVFYWRQPLRWRHPPDLLDAACEGRTGVVFVHGFMCNRGFWAPWLDRLRAAGTACVAVNLEPVYAPIDAHVQTVDAAVRQVTACTGRPPVLVCHSMGGLVARAWLRAAGPTPAVARVITIASPHRGTWMGRFSRMPNGRQMRLHSDWLAALERDEAKCAMPPWTCWYTNCDNMVFPPSAATLPWAENRFVAARAHVDLAFTPEVLQHTLAALTPGAASESC